MIAFGIWERPISLSQKDTSSTLEEINLGDGTNKTPTYISAKLDPSLKIKVIEILKEFKDCFAWDYHEILQLSQDLVELKLPIKPDKRHIKHTPRRFAAEVMLKIKEEIERILKNRFIRHARYVKWLANIIPMIKKNGTLWVCIDFIDLNVGTPKDKYPFLVAKMLVDSETGFKYLRLLDGYSGYNQIFIAEEYMDKMELRCPGELGTYEQVVIPFGLKTIGETYQRVT